MKIIFLFFVLIGMNCSAEIPTPEAAVSFWKGNKEPFAKPEESFKRSFQILKENYVDKGVSEESLYLAATEGMLASLNSDSKKNWNTLLSPRAMEDKQIEMSGRLIGIGATLEFDKATGNAKVRDVISGSAALKAGIKVNDQILSVNGKRYKELAEMVADIRGKTGETVKLRILREDQIVEMKIARAPVNIPLIESFQVDDQTGYLSLNTFSKDAQADVKAKLAFFKDKKIRKLILDLRGNRGGIFDNALEVADIFLNKGDVIVKAKTREGVTKEYKAKGNAWSPDTQIVVLTSEETASSAEVLTATLKENRKALVVGAQTEGKWTVESIESLPNSYFIKYSIMLLQSPSGKSYQDVGLSPDFTIAKSPVTEVMTEYNIKNLKKRLEKDSTFKAAVELK